MVGESDEIVIGNSNLGSGSEDLDSVETEQTITISYEIRSWYSLGLVKGSRKKYPLH